jgi:hypothetical protein
MSSDPFKSPFSRINCGDENSHDEACSHFTSSQQSEGKNDESTDGRRNAAAESHDSLIQSAESAVNTGDEGPAITTLPPGEDVPSILRDPYAGRAILKVLLLIIPAVDPPETRYGWVTQTIAGLAIVLILTALVANRRNAWRAPALKSAEQETLNRFTETYCNEIILLGPFIMIFAHENYKARTAFCLPIIVIFLIQQRSFLRTGRKLTDGLQNPFGAPAVIASLWELLANGGFLLCMIVLWGMKMIEASESWWNYTILAASTATTILIPWKIGSDLYRCRNATGTSAKKQPPLLDLWITFLLHISMFGAGLIFSEDVRYSFASRIVLSALLMLTTAFHLRKMMDLLRSSKLLSYEAQDAHIFDRWIHIAVGIGFILTGFLFLLAMNMKPADIAIGFGIHVVFWFLISLASDSKDANSSAGKTP